MNMEMDDEATNYALDMIARAMLENTDSYQTYVVHLIITNNAELNNNGARPVHEVFMQIDAASSLMASETVIDWHRTTFGEMDVNHMGTIVGTLAR